MPSIYQRFMADIRFNREFSHGKDMAYIQKTALEVIEYLKGLVLLLQLIRLYRI